MSQSVVSKYIWIADTIQRYGRITRKELNDLWVKASVSGGNAMSRRSFYNYRQKIAETFNIVIERDPATFEYYIASDESGQSSRLLNWMLDSVSMSGMLRDSSELNDRIIVEDVPSARHHLPVVLQALKANSRMTFSYKAYNRVNTVSGIVIEPYCVRLFKQLWYVIGYNLKDRKIKTYSLDRMSSVVINHERFEVPADFDATTYFNDCFGIMTSQGEAKNVILRVSSNQAKYFRALPLHHSQREELNDKYSLFYYHLFLTNDFVAEILSHGPEVQVVSPPELRAIVVSQLRSALDQY